MAVATAASPRSGEDLIHEEAVGEAAEAVARAWIAQVGYRAIDGIMGEVTR